MGLKKLNVFGNGDAFGTGKRYHTCFYLESSESCFLVDLGGTAIHNLQQNVELNDIDCIIISHLHGDHFGGIPYFILNCTFQTGRTSPLTIIGPQGTKQRVQMLVEALYKAVFSKFRHFPLNFLEYHTSVPIPYRDLEILALPAIHSEEANSHCLQIESGATKFAYSGDTEWTPDLLKISHSADYFICECSYHSTRMKGHLSYEELEKKLERISDTKVLLTHLGSEMQSFCLNSDLRFKLAEENFDYIF